MRIQCPENLRFPPEGSSAEGESGPKVRPKGVANGQRVNIPVPFIIDIEGPYRDWETDRKSTRLNSSHLKLSRMPSSA